MTLENLEYFLVAAEELNFTRAAERLYITQQSLSGHIAKIERYYNCRLFDRHFPMSLTPEGAELYEKGQKILSLANDTKRELQDIKDFRNSNLTIGISRSRSAVYLTSVLARYHKEYPGIRIKIIEGSAPEVEENLRRAKVDFSIGAMPENNYNVQSISFWQERIVATVPFPILDSLPPTSKMAIGGNPQYADWRMLADCPFIALSSNLRSGMPFYKIFQDLELSPKIVLEAQSIDTLLPLCLDGIGVLVCPEIFLYPYKASGQLDERNVLILPHTGEEYTRQVCINYLHDKYLSAAAKEFIRMLQEERYSLL